MPNIYDVYGAAAGKYLKAADLQERQPVVTIARTEQKTFEGGRSGRETKLLVYFVKKERALKCNVTQARAIAAIAGSEDTEHWIGIAIQLYATMTTYGGSPCQTIGVKAPGRSVAPRPIAVPAPRPRPIAVNESPREPITGRRHSVLTVVEE